MTVRRFFNALLTGYLLFQFGAEQSQTRAELPTSRLFTISPAGGKVGSVVELTVTGKDLDGAKTLKFSHPDISAELSSTNRFSVRIGTNVPPGLYDLWIIGNLGASNPRTFAVGDQMEVMATHGNHHFTNAQVIALGTTINGATTANQIDYFKFAAQKGQTIIVRCETAELDSRMEPILNLRDGRGHELARNRSEGSLSYTVRQDESLWISLHDVIYQGGPEFFYRLSIGTFPELTSLQPIESKPENHALFSMTGRNLLGMRKETNGQEQTTIELSPTNSTVRKGRFESANGAGLEVYHYRASNDHGVSEAANLLFPGTDRVIVANQTNQTIATAQTVAPPCEISGQFRPNRKSSWFTFEAKKGDIYWIDLVSERLGFASDPLLVMQYRKKDGTVTDVLELNDWEENAGGTEFNTKSRDPRGRFEAKEDGTYLIEVKDLFTRTQGSVDTQYQLKIKKPHPNFKLVAMPISPAPPQKDSKEVPLMTTVLRRLATVPIKIIALRTDGFEGPIEISIDHLPKGVTSVPSRIDSGKNSTVALLRSSNEIETSYSSARIRGVADTGGATITNEARFATLVWPVADPANDRVKTRECAEYLLSTVAETEPIRLLTEPNKIWEGVSTGKVTIALTVERSADYKIDTFNLIPIGATALDSVKEFEINGNASNAVYEVDLAQQKVPPGNYQFALRGFARGKRVKPPGSDPEYTVYSAPIQLKVLPVVTNAPAR